MYAPTADELNALPLKELQALRKRLDTAIETYPLRRKAEAFQAMRERARELGFSPDMLAPGRQDVATLYRNPDDPKQTWNGKGRRPRWINDALSSGMDIETLRS